MPSNPPRPVTRRPDPTAGDTGTMIDLGVLPEQPVAAPEPPAPPLSGYDVVEAA